MGMKKDTKEKLEETGKAKLDLGAKIRGYFIAGLLVVVPITITLYFAFFVVTSIDGWVAGLVPAQYNPNNYLPFSIPGLGLIAVFMALVVIGFFAANFFGRFLIRISEYLLDRVPVVKTIYGAIKQIMETVLANQSEAFREAVLLEYPRKGCWSIGFLTGTTSGEVQAVTKDKMINVFVPTTPNPTSGFLLFVPEKDIYRLHMTVEEALKMVVSGGIVTPPDRSPDGEENSIK
ncbi:MAG: hypothetical protein CMH32_07575 [Micavibrio sp.]|nr:hypothetical protein [Micavibrio sp.]HCK32091.1 hypothetical protein [Rhodospirillaceae bacterium]